MAIPTYKVCVIGESGVGKTSFVLHHLDQSFTEMHVATLGVEVHPIVKLGVCFNMWDCAGDDRFGGLREGYFIRSNACLLFATKDTLSTLAEWRSLYRSIDPEGPIVVVINKCDLKKISPAAKEVLGEAGMKVCEISVKNKKNLDLPLQLLREALNA